ncbi:MAG: hypothetical protein QXN87_08670 [Candidatus Bathyarchaeia archaeon]
MGSVEKLFNVSKSTIARKSMEIRKLLKIKPYDERFTPARIIEESPIKKFENYVRQAIVGVKGFFEVKEKGMDGVFLVDLSDGREYFAMERAALPKLRAGQVLCATIFPRGEAYVFSGVVKILDPEDKRQRAFIESVKDYYSGRYVEKAVEIQRELCKACMEYFGRTDPVFADARIAEEALNKFMKWFSCERKLSKEGKTPLELQMEENRPLPEIPKMKFPPELLEAGEVGVVFDEEAGILILPHYGQVKELFEGNYEKVPNRKSLVRSLVFEEEFIPSFLLKRLIKKNRKQAVKVFASTFKHVKSLRDIFNLLKKQRTDWNEKPKPTIIPIAL